MGAGQLLFFRALLRYTSSRVGFQANGLLPHENWTEEGVAEIWRRVQAAYAQVRQNKLPLSRDAVLLELETALAPHGDKDVVVDVREKLRQALAVSRPKSYFEDKLLRVLFPPSARELRERNSDKICRVHARWWCWKRSIVWMVLFVGMVLLPLLILLPLSFEPSALVFQGNATTLWTPAASVGGVGASREITPPHFVAVLVFSLLPPVFLVFLLAADACNALRYCHRRRYFCRGAGKRASSEEEASTPAPSSPGNAAVVQFASSSSKQFGKTPSSRSSVHALQRANEAAARADLEAAFVEVEAMFRFEWPATAAAQQKRNRLLNRAATTATTAAAAAVAAEEAKISHLPVFFALARFHKESDSPTVRLIRARALAGQIRFGLFSFLKSTASAGAGATSTMTTLTAVDKERMGDMADAMRALEESEPMETILLDADVVQSQFLYSVFQSAEFDEFAASANSYEAWEHELTNAFACADALLFGFSMLGGDLEDAERNFYRLIFRLMRAPAFSRKKELEYLAWIGLNRVKLARAVPVVVTAAASKEVEGGDGQSVAIAVRACEDLHKLLLVEERERARVGDAARRKSFYALVNHPQVKRSVFWLAMYKKSRQVEAFWDKHEPEKTRAALLPSEVERLADLQRELEQDILALIVMETDKPMHHSATAAVAALPAATPTLAEPQRERGLGSDSALFSSQLWDGVRNALILREHVDWISFREERWIEAFYARTLACHILFTFKQSTPEMTLSGVGPALVADFEHRFPGLASNNDRIARLFIWIELHYQQSRVKHEWKLLKSGEGKPIARQAHGEGEDGVEEVFRRGFSFTDAKLLAAADLTAKLKDLHAMACAGLILLQVKRGALLLAQEWTEKMRAQLSLKTILGSLPLKHALREYRRAYAKQELGQSRLLFYVYWSCWEHAQLLVACALFWLMFLLPLLLGINYLSHSIVVVPAPSNNGEEDSSRFYMRWTGILLPICFALFAALRWTLVRRVRWFGEQEAQEELEESMHDLLAVAKRFPEMGGEYPQWEMGEHIVTGRPPLQQPHMRRHRRIFPNKRGLRLVLLRAGLVLLVFSLFPLVLIPPLLTLPKPGAAERSAMWCLVFALPICTWSFVAYRLVSDALPGPARHGANLALVWLGLFFILPLLCGIPLLMLQQQQGGADTACVWAWLILGPVLSSCIAAMHVHRHWNEIRTWASSLTWDAHSLTEIVRFCMQVSTIGAIVFPVLSFLFLLGAIASPTTTTTAALVSLFIAVAVFQLISCFAAVALCTSGVKLGYIRQDMAASSLLPMCYIVLGSFIVFQSIAGAMEPTPSATMGLLASRRQLEVALWSCAAQLVCAAFYVMQVQRAHAQHKRFGYFPEDWELYDPTSRFVVEEAKQVPFLSQAELRDALLLQSEQQHDLDTSNRGQAERIIEEAWRKDALERRQVEELLASRLEELRTRYNGQRLAQLVFSQVVLQEKRGQDDDDAVAVEQHLAQFRVTKWRCTLNDVLRRGSVYSRLVERYLRLAAPSSHMVQVMPGEIRMVNLLLGVLNPLPLSGGKEADKEEGLAGFAWMGEDGLVLAAAAGEDGRLAAPETILKCVELTFKSRRVRILVFDTMANRQAFIRALFEAIGQQQQRLSWTYSTDPRGIDRLCLRHGTEKPPPQPHA